MRLIMKTFMTFSLVALMTGCGCKLSMDELTKKDDKGEFLEIASDDNQDGVSENDCIDKLALDDYYYIPEKESKKEGQAKDCDNGEFLGVVSDGNWNDHNHSDRIKDVVIDEKMALAIGDAVIKREFGEDAIEGYTFEVYEVKGENTFIVKRFAGGLNLASTYSVAISKIDGAIIRIWMSPEG